jgi:hypothetical protein
MTLTPSERDERVAEIREALKAATPGPWVAVLSASVTENYDVVASDLRTRVAADTFDAGCIDREDDALLIANSPQWLAFLLDELSEARTRLDLVREGQVWRNGNCGFLSTNTSPYHTVSFNTLDEAIDAELAALAALSTDERDGGQHA